MSDDVSDPSDWQTTSLPFLGPLDAALRCQVCKDFFNAAVITGCSHTFCSLCIRRCLAADGRCPTCRAVEQEVRLRRNVTLQEVADLFVAARPEAFKFARERLVHNTEDVPAREGGDSRKRKRGDAGVVNATGVTTTRRRSQRIQGNGQNSPSPTNVVTLEDDNDIAQERKKDDDMDEDYEPEDGLVPCPICQTRMKAEMVFGHLDNCQGETSSKAASNGRIGHSKDLHSSRSENSTSLLKQKETSNNNLNNTPPERLPQINYNLLKDNALRKKLSELNLANAGPRALLIRRHAEWTNLWNANCDSARPRSRRELVKELHEWERSQGALAVNGGQPVPAVVMRKDFDGAAWARENKSDFDDLIASARRKKEPPNTDPIAITDESTSIPTSTQAQNSRHAHPRRPSVITDSIVAPAADRTHVTTRRPSHISTSSNASPTGTGSHSRRGSVQWPENDPPSIFSPPHPTLELQRTATRSPVPGFSFEKSVQFGHREPPPPRTSYNMVSPSAKTQQPVWGLESADASVNGEHQVQDTRHGLRRMSQQGEAQAHIEGVRKVPMFEVPSAPVEDAEMGDMK